MVCAKNVSFCETCEKLKLFDWFDVITCEMR